ncbi:MAG: hypothetical protein FJ254_03340 [Phycisphaerae bacterium]|nr:hypothetical protein [Phycisphaerae bacterium]
MMIASLAILHLAFMQDAAAPTQDAAAPAPVPATEPTKPEAPSTSFGELVSIEAFEQTLQRLAAASDGKVTLTSIGTSTSGRAIHAVHVTNQPNRKVPIPTVLIVAGLDGWHRSGSLVAAGIAERFAMESRAAIDARTVLDALDLWVIPVANPDAWAVGVARPQELAGRVGARVDDDRDGRLDEDAPCDINGDGVIAMMRRLDCPSDAPATLVADPADARLDRAPDRDNGQLATFSLLTESLDRDADGSVGEDAVGGITMDANFPHLWREFAADAGRFPLEAPEAKALAEFVRAHPGVGAVYVLGRQDSLARTPNHERRDITGRTPVFIDGEDKGLYERIGKLYRESTGIERARDATHEGSFAAWCYAHRGLPTFCSQLWQRPDPSPPPEEKKDAPKPVDEDAAAWLAWSDRDQGGRGFLPWKSFDHPTLGKVEIGGWVPGFRTEPPSAMLPDLITKHARFVAALAGESARVHVERVKAREVAPGVTEITVDLVNDGRMPMTTAMARTNDAIGPLRLRAKVGVEALLAGSIERRIERLDPGSRASVSWTVRRAPKTHIEIDMHAPNGRYDRIIVDDDSLQLGGRVLEGGWTW